MKAALWIALALWVILFALGVVSVYYEWWP